MRYLRPSAEIRQEWQYNNLHYTVLSHMIPTLLGVPYIEFVKDQILDPLGITATYNATRAKESGQRTDGFLRLGRNLTSCIEEWKGLKRIPETCLGTPVPLGWWTDTDGVFLAGPAGLIMSGKDMASQPI
jgi:CubicO group peptidase (beta-lactamase class C family)